MIAIKLNDYLLQLTQHKHNLSSGSYLSIYRCKDSWKSTQSIACRELYTFQSLVFIQLGITL